jgi:putative acetyltransferase
METRQERSGDEQSIAGVHADAFSMPDHPGSVPTEVALVDQLRASHAWIPALSLVAVENQRIVGHVLCSRAHVEEVPVLGLGPIGVASAFQSRGIGTALMGAVIHAADELGGPLIGLLGATSYYSRFGFAPASEVGISSPNPEWGNHFQILRLDGYRENITGRFEYARPFEQV